jgi:hypothetical protein
VIRRRSRKLGEPFLRGMDGDLDRPLLEEESLELLSLSDELLSRFFAALLPDFFFVAVVPVSVDTFVFLLGFLRFFFDSSLLLLLRDLLERERLVSDESSSDDVE